MKHWSFPVTLSTNVYALDAVDAHEVFRFCQTMLAKYDEAGRSPDQQRWSDEARTYGEPGAWSIHNHIGQDLPGILDVTYRPNGPLRTAEQAAAHDEDCDDDCSGIYHDVACWLDVDFDTAYGYRDAEGRGCGDLHALLVAELGQWFVERGVRWSWRNEYTSEVHGGPDRYERLIDLVSGGFESAAWFRTSVMPAILNQFGG